MHFNLKTQFYSNIVSKDVTPLSEKVFPFSLFICMPEIIKLFSLENLIVIVVVFAINMNKLSKGKLFRSFPLCVFVVYSTTTRDEQFERFPYEKFCVHRKVENVFQGNMSQFSFEA